uniref:Magnesium transporter n=1 Tax=Rhizochromulina marina TaxID=1034831 RepID=A0A7S2WW35_9STRA|mmetsp:Transcript_7275/g.20956  ORF Transcript_7275/g.20956 Transcript_7275/m.20956 type:complete len:151 (+) Transcript_7275:114-566(+)
MMALAVQSSATPLPVADTPSSPGAIMDQDSDVAELLFESFLQSVSTVQAKLEVVRGNVTNGEEYHRARLDTVRNSILNAEILFSLVSMCASLANLVVGMFGMNLRNGHEGSTRAFTTVASVATGIVILLSVTLGARYRQIGVISAFPGDG